MSVWSQFVDAADHVVRPLRQAWRTSVSLRVVATTLALSLIVVGLVGALLLQRIYSGVLDAKVRASVVEAGSGAAESQRLLDAADTGPTTPTASRLVDTVTAALAQRAGSPGLYDVLLLASPPKTGDEPERGTNLISEISVPPDLRISVQDHQRQAWTYTDIRYLENHSSPGLAVGAP